MIELHVFEKLNGFDFIKMNKDRLILVKLLSKMEVENKWIGMNDIASFEVRVGDINYGGHMGNDKALLLFHDARIRFLESFGFSESNIGDDTGIIMRDAHVVFRKEVFLHDELLADIAVSDVSSTSFNLEYKIRRISDETVVMTGATGIIAFDYEKRKVVRLPDVFLKAITC